MLSFCFPNTTLTTSSESLSLHSLTTKAFAVWQSDKFLFCHNKVRRWAFTTVTMSLKLVLNLLLQMLVKCLISKKTRCQIKLKAFPSLTLPKSITFQCTRKESFRSSKAQPRKNQINITSTSLSTWKSPSIF